MSSTQTFEICLLKDNISIIPILAQELYKEWSYVYKSLGYNDVNDVENQLKLTSENVDKIPITFIIKDKTNHNLICTASIDTCDLPTYHPYGFKGFWVNCVYTMSQYRGQGYCYILMKHLLAFAIKIDIHCLWLYTENMENTYKKFGFKTIEKMLFDSHPITIMRWDNHHFHKSKL